MLRMTTFALALLMAGPVIAQEARDETAPVPGGRFILNEVDGGFLRLDRYTGLMSICRHEKRTWTCQVVADDRQAYEDEIDRLALAKDQVDTRLKGLASRLEVLEKRLARADKRTLDKGFLTSEDRQRLDRFMTFSQEAMQRLFGMVEELKKDLDGAL